MLSRVLPANARDRLAVVGCVLGVFWDFADGTRMSGD